MTDRVNGLIVVLEKSMRDDDVQRLVDAILMLKNVQSVHPNIENPERFIIEEKVKSEIKSNLFDLIQSM